MGPSVLVSEMMIPVMWTAGANSTALAANEPAKIPGNTRHPPAIAATMAIATGSQIGAGKSP